MSGEIAGAGGASVGCDGLDRARRGAAQIFARLVWLYTAGESTSIAEEEAERLLGSMAYVLGVRSLDDPAAVAVLACDDPLGAFEERRAALKRRAATTVEAWREVAAIMSKIPNKSLVETMASIAEVPRRYNTYFSAQDVPAEPTYQPHGFDGRELLGIDAVELWLDAARDEAAWLVRFSADDLTRVLDAHVPGYLDANTSLRDLIEPYTAELLLDD
ncbi:DUF6179 domain-containing protein [Tractidigestivibacter scatoligenes]|uniref:DUF6179 domain-containing protein n=1 Tax=Tractidigestivibacter scatoligenes TaxID=1299998 RepID=UPI002F356629